MRRNTSAAASISSSSGTSITPARRSGRNGRKLERGGRDVRVPERDFALIKESEHPERHLIVVDVFYVVLDHKPIRDIFNLFLSLLSTSHFESLSIDFEV